MGTVIQMFAASTGGAESGLAAIDIPLTGNIVGVEWSAFATIDTTLDNQTWQLSFGSTLTIANDSRQVISNCTIGLMSFLTAVGVALGMAQHFTTLPSIPCSMGERLFVHSSAAAGVIGIVRVAIHFDFDLDKPAARRR